LLEVSKKTKLLKKTADIIYGIFFGKNRYISFPLIKRRYFIWQK